MPRTADELPDDDDEAISILSGQLYDGCEIGRRERKLWPKRNCPPSVKRDPEMTERFKRAVVIHDEELDELMADVERGDIDLAKITESDIISGFHALAKDKRRPAVQLGALTRLAEMKGLLKNKERGVVTDDKLESMLDELAARRDDADR
jgi:hypothetical protein